MEVRERVDQMWGNNTYLQTKKFGITIEPVRLFKADNPDVLYELFILCTAPPYLRLFPPRLAGGGGEGGDMEEPIQTTANSMVSYTHLSYCMTVYWLKRLNGHICPRKTCNILKIF